ncbi:MAG: 2-amino-4-hydroxy-6-hydroxymethyldihydropteridine diphosphokinase, partial [Sphingomonadaceae bacterium]|nr:2-amino-4-hydroxy-6-hydroxymethyldihydropteridine diphosphokinase [Sphingomonadaceae bacterium]
MAVMHYALSLGSNSGRPKARVSKAIAALAESGCEVLALSRLIETRPLGPAARNYVNAAAIVATSLAPRPLLRAIKRIESCLGRRPGRRWGDRPIDIDIILWSEGAWADRALTIPHRRFRERSFVLGPLLEIAPGWRDPVTGLSIRQLTARLARPR